MAGRTVRRTRSGSSLPPDTLPPETPAHRRARRGPAALLAGLALAGAVLAGCGTAAGDSRIAVPTFTAEDSGSPQAGADPVPIALPTDCAVLMEPEEAGALFGQVLGSVSVQTVRGVPQPSVNRTERTACTYRAGGQEQAFGAGGDSGPVLYELNIGRYTDSGSATSQWQLNTNAERGNATASRDLRIGDVPAVLIERPEETVLALVYGVDTLTFVLPVDAPGQTRPAAETLPDLAQRILAVLAPTQPPGSRPAATAAPNPAPAPVPADGTGSAQARRTPAGDAPGTT